MTLEQSVLILVALMMPTVAVIVGLLSFLVIIRQERKRLEKEDDA